MLAISAVAILATVMPANAASLKDFGRCLASKGATFYGASWCPYCSKQRQTLGDAMPSVRYVECSVDGGRGASASACTSARVESYPTWVFADGTRAQGAQSLAALASKTGCPLPSGSGKTAPASKDSGNAARPSGPKIMEIPQKR